MDTDVPGLRVVVLPPRGREPTAVEVPLDGFQHLPRLDPPEGGHGARLPHVDNVRLRQGCEQSFREHNRNLRDCWFAVLG